MPANWEVPCTLRSVVRIKAGASPAACWISARWPVAQVWVSAAVRAGVVGGAGAVVFVVGGGAAGADAAAAVVRAPPKAVP